MRRRPDIRFLFRLAGHLGKTVGELVETIDPRELALWRAFDGIEPFGDEWRRSMRGIHLLLAAKLGRDSPYRSEDDLMPTVKMKPTDEELGIKVLAAFGRVKIKKREE